MLLHDAFDFHARARGSSLFSQFAGQTPSYAEAHAATLRIAAGMLAAGVRRGDRVCLLLHNSPEVLLTILAASRIGAVVVPLNYRLSPREWLDLTADAEAVALIADAEFAVQMDAFLEDRPMPFDLLKICICACDGWCDFADLVDYVGDLPVFPKLEGGDIIFQMYTSGTTGQPKGILLSQQGIIENIVKSSFAMPYRLNPGENSLVVLPLFHIAAISTALCAIASGACLVIHREVDPAAIVKALIEDEIVVATLVPAVIQVMLDSVPNIEEVNFPKLRYLGYGASPIAEPVLRRAMKVFKCDLCQGYGMTEIGGPATFLTEADHRRALSGEPSLLLSVGKPLPGTEIMIVAADGQPASVGVVGEILVRGEELLVGYWKQPEASAGALDGGWLHTGDAGYLDAEGYLYIRDRVKDMIVSGAENIYPVEIEAVLFDHPSVADAAVVGIPDDRWGEAVMAVLVTWPGQEVSAEELDRFCRKRLGGFKVPRHYEFVESLPRNASGKVLKRELRGQYWQGRDRAIG